MPENIRGHKKRKPADVPANYADEEPARERTGKIQKPSGAGHDSDALNRQDNVTVDGPADLSAATKAEAAGFPGEKARADAAKACGTEVSEEAAGGDVKTETEADGTEVSDGQRRADHQSEQVCAAVAADTETGAEDWSAEIGADGIGTIRKQVSTRTRTSSGIRSRLEHLSR